ncbi:MAG TPA: alpha/beta hydrolase-fold protein [Ignavibacteriaceae bacterium]|nr:alpha/beta hydrolase-fold protein [Ignavibacteriaceae bacterium]
MKKLIYFLLVLTSLDTFAQSRLLSLQFYSQALQANKNVNVYLPDGYNENDAVHYPVIYYLHGAGGNQNSDAFIKDTLDAMISSGRIQPVILVKPDGSTLRYLGSFYTNSTLYGNFEDYIVNDLVSFIDSAFKTTSKRGIIGHSMGAFGAAKLAFKHQNKFIVFAAHSGPLDFSKLVDLKDRIIYESGSIPYHYSPANGIFSLLGFTMAGAFSPNLQATPEPVDFLIDSMGIIIDSIFEKWNVHNPTRLAQSYDKSLRMSIYFDCGTYDELGMYSFNTAFRDSLVSLNIPHKFISFSGLHSQQLKTRIPVSLKFVDSVFNSTATYAKNDNAVLINKFTLEQNYPNPFNGETIIRYNVPKKSTVKIKIFNVIGREVDTILEEEKEEGEYSVRYSAKSLSSGVYYYQVQEGDQFNIKKMILLK